MKVKAVDDIRKKMKREGPVAIEHPRIHPDYEEQDSDIEKFNPKTSRKGSTRGFKKGISKPVYYIPRYHIEEVVFKRWLEVNEIDLSDPSNARSLHVTVSQLGDPWKSISREEVVPYANYEQGGSHHGGSRGGTCSICGKEYEGFLPDHLPDCSGDQS